MDRPTIFSMRPVAALAVMCAIVLSSGLAAAEERVTAKASLQNADGNVIGRVHFFSLGGKVAVSVYVWGASPGFHGFHVHAVGACDPATAFMSAGGHFNPMAKPHPQHAGDLPPLLVNADGTAWATMMTDRFTLSQLFDADGSAVILHSLPDDFANIPTRYWSSSDMVPLGYAGGPDLLTLMHGDSGARVGCGVVR
jgi:Cu-Zn family superoxide dismutase